MHMVDKTTEHAGKGASGESNGKSAFFVDGIFLGLDDERSKVADKFAAVNCDEQRRVRGRVKSRHG